MGYEVHITRAEEWVESENFPISLADWKAYVNADPEMRLDGYAEATTPQGETIRIESAGIVVWISYSGHGVGGNMAWFSWFGGRVSVKGPDKEILQKMHAIAKALNARVLGDEGERYDADGESDWQPAAPRDIPWWKRLFGR